MPVTVDRDVRVMEQEEFGRVAYDVMEQAFAIHNSLGRHFHEGIYRNELVHRLGARATTELGIHVSHGGFRKDYRIDLLVDSGAPFELKAAEQLHAKHRGQLVNYLMLTGLAHGKLVNFRSHRVEHEFVNNHVTLEQRQTFRVHKERLQPLPGRLQPFEDVLLSVLRDWGTCLDLELYVEAITHAFGGKEVVEHEVEVTSNGRTLGTQRMRLVDAQTAFKVTALDRKREEFEAHLMRLLEHIPLRTILWVNITLGEVQFVSVSK